MIVKEQDSTASLREKWRQGDILENLQPGVHTSRFQMVCRYKETFFLADLTSGHWFNAGASALEELQVDNSARFRVYRGILTIENGDI